MMKMLICGGLLIDRYVTVDRFPARGGDGYITDSFDVVGGCALNMAKAARSLGAEPHIASFLGNDAWSIMISDFMEKERLPMDCIGQMRGSTGHCVVFLEPDGERTFLTRKGCEAEYDDSLIPGLPYGGYSVCAVTGYYLLDGTSGKLVDRLRELKDGGCPIVFDPGPLVDKIDESLVRRILGLCYVVTPNVAEAEALAGIQGEAGAEAWAKSLSGKGCAVIITKGGDGGDLYQNGVKTAYAAEKTDIVDTTGAGDGFTGAIAHALGTGMPLEKGVKLAARTAGLVASVRGPHL